MTGIEVFASLTTFAGGLLGVLRLRDFWRGAKSVGDPEVVPSYVFYSKATWQGLLRTRPLAVPIALCVGPWLALDRLADTSAERTVADLLLVITALLAALALVVFLFNRPRSVVPPFLRNRPGWLVATVRRVMSPHRDE